MRQFIKGASETLDFTFDRSLDPDESVVTSEWFITGTATGDADTPLTKVNDDFFESDTVDDLWHSRVWYSGGAIGEYEITNRVVTDASPVPRTLVRSISFLIVPPLIA